MVEGCDTPDGKPPAMGTVTLTEGGVETVLTTFDLSIGAFDDSAWFKGMQTGAPRLHLSARPDANPDAPSGMLYPEAQFREPVKPGAWTANATAALLMGTDRVGRRWTSEADGAATVSSATHPASPRAMAK